LNKAVISDGSEGPVVEVIRKKLATPEVTHETSTDEAQEGA
jgi:hypothetical protein